jgi:cell division protein FtsB
MTEPIPSKKEIVGLVEAQANSIDDISKRFYRIESLVNKQEFRNEKQENRNRDIMIAVLVAFVLIVGSVAVSVVVSNKKDAGFYSTLEKNVYDQNLKVQDLNNRVDNIKIRNPYLK